MGLFDLFRKNKNIITENGLNKIYFDNGKGAIKEQFVKINGLIDGEFFVYERNGTYLKKHYENGEICLTEEEQQEKKRQDEINKVIQQQIDDLLNLDNLIVEITNIPQLMQMDNRTIEIYTRWICTKLSNKFEEEIIKFYLFTKRNHFIREFILSGDETMLSDKYFTEIIKDFPIKRLMPRRKFEWYNITTKEQILDKIWEDKLSGRALICNFSIWTYGFDDSIFNQESVLFGMNFKAYELIFDVLTKNEKKYGECLNGAFTTRLFKDSYLPIYVTEEMIIENAIKEINSICDNNRKNQEEIILNIN
jgi:hypothetical protein